ncbi:ribosome biogenesis GTP-binding protein YihA/YsxC [Woodsholea maritima]|uniref:ribosome biogenesis GTP-binding protein YihA/YsxC n=1 Tax=Woodsholea maritima TaxID=240237 RepID=UPI0003610FAA|nr:ribosome biogenesis GTP-binding protein YihA/YsxC [Woodsholea maritima]
MSEETSSSSDDAHAARLEAGRMLFAAGCEFMMGAVNMNHLPPSDVPEIAFAGRSNVGKSSLVNAITGRKSIARTSGDPGRTRELNFFNLSDRLRIVDLPGYGFAKAPKDVAQRWTSLTQDYLRGRVNLKRVILLIDSRHGIKESDEAIMQVLDKSAVVYQICLTKLDKLRPDEQEPAKIAAAQKVVRRAAAYPLIAATSSAKKLGIEELRADLADLALPG